MGIARRHRRQPPLVRPGADHQSFYYDSKLPSDVQWNVGFQMALPWASSIDVEYVGHHSYNVLSHT